MPVALVILVLLLAALVIGGTFVLGAPILAIPILLLLPGPFVTLAFTKRQLQQRKIARFREQARAQKTSFDARDEQTLV